jgi:hypothetical protein
LKFVSVICFLRIVGNSLSIAVISSHARLPKGH